MMERDHIQSEEVFGPWGSDEEKRKWVEERARRLQQVFERWQKPLGIDSEKYYKHLIKDLAEHCNEPLMKSLIDTIT